MRDGNGRVFVACGEQDWPKGGRRPAGHNEKTSLLFQEQDALKSLRNLRDRRTKVQIRMLRHVGEKIDTKRVLLWNERVEIVSNCICC
jgi:hypothetical protein